jgi:hypothetical protein
VLELHSEFIDGQIEPLANIGAHWQINNYLIMLASAGREFGSKFDAHQSFLFYVGIQFLKEP